MDDHVQALLSGDQDHIDARIEARERRLIIREIVTKHKIKHVSVLSKNGACNAARITMRKPRTPKTWLDT